MQARKQFEPTPEIIGATKAVLISMAHTEAVRPIVEGYQRAILGKYRFHIAKHWRECGDADRVILEPRQAYLLEDADFDIYLKECDEEMERSGLSVKTKGNCPLLEAENIQRIAEDNLLDVMAPISGFNAGDVNKSRNCLENRKKALGITLKFLSQFVRLNKKGECLNAEY